MKAMAIKDFTASMSGRDFKCASGDEIEADAKTIGQLEATGLVTTAIKDFTASMSGRDFKCASGDEIEADAKTIGQLEATGLVTGETETGLQAQEGGRK